MIVTRRACDHSLCKHIIEQLSAQFRSLLGSGSTNIDFIVDSQESPNNAPEMIQALTLVFLVRKR